MTDRAARFREVYGRHHRHIYAYCFRRTRADMVDDAVADTFLTAWRKVDELPTDDGVLPWLYSVAYRVLGRQRRGTSRRSHLAKKLANAGVEFVPPPEQFVIANHESNQVMQAASKLTARDQEILRLAIWEDLSRPDIAKVLGISTKAVRQRLYEARKRLTREYDRLEKKRVPFPVAQKGGAR